jgi:hypothetical protein
VDAGRCWSGRNGSRSVCDEPAVRRSARQRAIHRRGQSQRLSDGSRVLRITEAVLGLRLSCCDSDHKWCAGYSSPSGADEVTSSPEITARVVARW